MKKFTYLTICTLISYAIPAAASAQLNPIHSRVLDTVALKSLENSIHKDPCPGGKCPDGKTCTDGCCIYPLGVKAQGNWDYLIYNDCKPMEDLKLSFKVTKELEAEYDVAADCAQSPNGSETKIKSTEGVVVQFNCFSKDADKVKNAGGMIQYIFYVQGKSIWPHIQYVSGTPDGIDHDWSQSSISFSGLTLPKDNAIPAGYTLKVDFGTDKDGYVDDVTFTVVDDKGKSYEIKAPKKGAHVSGATSSHPETLYPLRITEFQTNVVSTNGRYVHFKSGGEGTLSYSSKGKLCVEGGSYEHCTGAGVGTCESSNAIYGNLSSCCTEDGKSFSQSVSIK